MPQHDYNIANDTGLNFRTDLNNALQAVVTVNSGTTQPAVTFPGMLWLDLSGGGDGVMRRRNQANSAWLSDIGNDQVARDAASAANANANTRVLRAGDTMTGVLNLIANEPANNAALSRQWADTLYQVRLPTATAGSLLVGAAGGWLTSMAIGVANSIMSVSGGLPTWQATGTVAAPGIVVRTLADGTIDPSFIPSVASGLRYCGTFRPAVNFEYPTTGGHGSGGAPAIGDFWVIDGLTTGGYTYLTGTLAGVTVFNGDSIAYNGSGAWFRMGNTINMQGFLRTDGTVAMAGPLNMGGFAINNVNGIAGRAGTPVPLTNFVIDSTNQVISPQRGTTGADLAAMATGQLGTDLGRMQLFVGASGANVAMLPVRFHSTTAAYALGDYVASGGYVYRAPGAVAAGAFTPAQWARVLDSAGGWNVQNSVSFSGAAIIMSTGSITWMRASDSAITASWTVSADGSVINMPGPGGNTFIVEASRTRIFRASLDAVASWEFAGNTYGRVAVDSAQSMWMENANGGGRFEISNAGTFNLKTNAALGTTAGAGANYFRLTVATNNVDALNMYMLRTANGSAWDTATWSLRRTVDASTLGFINFGSGDRRVALGAGAQEAMWINAIGVVGMVGNGSNGNNVGEAAINLQGAFGGGLTMQDSGVQARMWMQGDPSIRFAVATGTGPTPTPHLSIFTTGCTAPQFTPTCDRDHKQDITEIDVREDLADHLHLYTYRMKGAEKDSPLLTGSMAQDWQELAPSYVRDFGEGQPLGLDIVGLLAEMVAGINTRLRRLENDTLH